MSQVDERDLRDLARTLANLYQELDSLKYSRPAPPEVRTMKPAPGPQSPGNWLYVACWLDQSVKLREVAFNALGDVHVKIRDNETGPIALCRKLAFHAQAIAELAWASDLTDELEHQTKVISRHCRPHDDEVGTVDDDGEVWLTARTITYKLREQGYRITPELLRKWAQRKRIQSKDGDRIQYSLREVLQIAQDSSINRT